METPSTERAGSVEFRVLGSVEVIADGQPLALDGRKSRELLAFLLLHANEPVRATRIVDALWGDDAPLTVDASLRVAVSKLRKALEPIGARDSLETSPSGYVLRVEPDVIDASRFERLAAEGRASLEDERWADASARLADALELWRGDPFPEIATSEDAAAERRRLGSRCLDVRDDLTDARLALGRHEGLVPELESLLEQQPTRERRAAQLMLALYRSGRQADALDVYARTRATLLADLGLEPGPQLRELQGAVLRQDPALDLPVTQSLTQEGQTEAGSEFRTRRAVLLATAFVLGISVAAAVMWRIGNSSDISVTAVPNSVAVVDDSGRVLAAPPTGARPGDVVLADGSAWVASEEATITQVDVASRQIVRTIGLGFEPTGLAAGNGFVWAVGGYDHQLVRIDTSDGGVRLRIQFRERLGPLPEGYERGPAGVAVGPDGIWVSHGVELTRFDARTGEVERTVRAGGPWASPIAVGNGYVWVAYDGQLTEAGEQRSTPAVDAVALVNVDRTTRIHLAGGAGDIEVADGYVWVAIGRADAVWRIDPRALTVDATMPAGDAPVALAVDDGVWVSNYADGTITRLDPSSGATIDVFPIGHTLTGISAVDGEVWVTVRAP